jgi:hypothetical protein
MFNTLEERRLVEKIDKRRKNEKKSVNISKRNVTKSITMNVKKTLKDDLVIFAVENIVDPNIDDDEHTAEVMADSLITALKADDDWKLLERVKEELLDVSSIPPWLDVGSSKVKDAIDEQLSEAAQELQSVFKSHLDAP